MKNLPWLIIGLMLSGIIGFAIYNNSKIKIVEPEDFNGPDNI